MIQGIPDYHALARRLLLFEAGQVQTSIDLIHATDSICHKLRDSMAPLIGKDGIHAVLVRAMAMARDQHPVIKGVYIEREMDHCLHGLAESLRQSTDSEVEETVTAIIAKVFWLLSTLIGHSLTLGQIRYNWPSFPLSELDSTPKETTR